MSAPHSISDMTRAGVEDHANVNFPPPLIHGVCILSAVGLNALFPLTLAESALFWWLGQSLFLVALAVALPSFRQFANSGNTGATQSASPGFDDQRSIPLYT